MNTMKKVLCLSVIVLLMAVPSFAQHVVDNSANNVGIGTSDPVGKLQVDESGTTTAILTTIGGDGILFSGTSSATTADVFNIDAATTSGLVFDINSSALNTGTVFDIDATALTTGTLFDVSMANTVNTGAN
ncbi:MAG: hypothetical protein KC618_07245, partial [Candidatus Omnitrophica bacterium]|nr:hypothetical protein [Candidatus Omnitrophota bacterium]